jgi:cardiolipin synthase
MLANTCTAVRILLLPLLLWVVRSQFYLLGFILLGLIGLTDILDGWIARKTRTASKFGAIFDVTADCIVVFSLQGFLLAVNVWPLHVFILSLTSLVSFVAASRHKTENHQKSLGKYTGALFIVVFMAAMLCWRFFPSISTHFISIVGSITALFLCLVIVENLLTIFVRQETG